MAIDRSVRISMRLGTGVHLFSLSLLCYDELSGGLLKAEVAAVGFETRFEQIVHGRSPIASHLEIQRPYAASPVFVSPKRATAGTRLQVPVVPARG